MTPDLFNRPTGEDLRDAAMSQMEAGNGASWLELARNRLAQHCRENPGVEVTSDDIHRLTPKPDYLHSNVLGAVFRHPLFKATGQWKATTRRSGHARAVRIYRLAEETQT